MTFLTPWSALLTAATAIPLLLLLYFLRLRRQRLRVASTLLWMKSFEDLQANAPFQRLRWSLLLLLQLLLLLALLLALAQPTFRGDEGMATRLVLLIDRSASMNAAVPADDEKHRTRLDAAKDAARAMIQNLGRGAGSHQVMIIAFGSSAQVVSTFESNRGVLLDAIDSIQPTDEQDNFEEALELAGAFTAAREEDEESPDVVLLSDGCFAGSETGGGYRLRAGRFRFVQVAPAESPPSRNIGITSFSVRRDDDDPARAVVFARLVNAGADAAPVVATLWNGEESAGAVRATIPAATETGPGEYTISLGLELPDVAALTLRHNHSDELAADDSARLMLPAPSQPRLALVHPNGLEADPFLHDLLAAMEPQRLDVMSIDAYAAADSAPGAVAGQYDMIAFDRVAAESLPGVGSLTVGASPSPLTPLSVAEAEGQGQLILSWDRQHPVMRNVSLDTIVFSDFSAFDVSENSPTTALAFGPAGPIMIEVRQRHARHIVVGFEMRQSNWPLHVSSAVFVQNVIDYLTLASRGISAPGSIGQHSLAFRAGEPITVRAANDAAEMIVDGPVQARLPAEPGAIVSLPSLRRAGWYTIAGASPPLDRIAVNVTSDVESDTRPRETVMVNAEPASARRGSAIAARPLWPWLIGAAFALLVLEWLVYCRRAAR